VDSLSWLEEVFFYRLIVNCDDYGRCDARPAILKAKLFPLKDVTSKQIMVCLNKLSSAGMVLLYEQDSRPYLQMVTWTDHQQVRNRRSKYPAPDEKHIDKQQNCKQLKSIDINCNQLKSFAPVIQSNPIQSESESNPYVCTERQDASAPNNAVMYLQLKDNTMYGITDAMITEWSSLYPAVDIMQELRNMCGWLKANSNRRKTKAGINRFINGWLANEQGKGGSGHVGTGTFKPSRT